MLHSPSGVAIDKSGSEGPCLYVCDLNNHRICVFSLASGSFLRSWGRHGTRPGEFNMAYDVEVYGPHVYIADAMNDRVQVFLLFHILIVVGVRFFKKTENTSSRLVWLVPSVCSIVPLLFSSPIISFMWVLRVALAFRLKLNFDS